MRIAAYLSRVDPLAGEAVFVGTHLAALCGLLATRCIWLGTREFGVDKKMSSRSVDTFNFTNWSLCVQND